MACLDEKINLFELILDEINEKVDFLIHKRVIEELEKISKTKSVKRKKANLALCFLNKNMKRLKLIENYELNNDVDHLLLEIAKKGNYIIATADMKLAKKCKENKIKVLFLRKAKRRIQFY
ncbi:MAG TPA: hypothetical protein ENG40_03490 [Thermoprotei archaeon]|nr:hypothetical protein [Thermoprotei archaeon]